MGPAGTNAKFEEVEFKKESSEEEINIQSLYKSSEAPAIVKLVSMIIVDGIQSRASDIHIEPREKNVLVRYRVDGELRDVLRVPKNIQNSVISRIKIISNWISPTVAFPRTATAI